MADSQRKSYNLFDKTGTVYQAYLTETQWLPNEDSTSVKIPCSPNTIYTISVTTELPIFRIATSDNLNIQPQNAVDVVARLANVTQYTFTTSSTAQVIIFQGSRSMVNTWLAELMVNTGSTALPYEPYGWVHSLRKLTTATEAIENPLYSDGTAITSYTIKGNTVQSGTPTPSNPVTVQGVGERTENLFDKNTMYVTKYYLNGADGQYQKTSGTLDLCSIIVPVEPSKTYTIKITNYTKRIGFFANYPREADYPESYYNSSTGSYTTSTFTLTAPSTANYLVVYCYSSVERNAGYTIDDVISNIMLVEGETAPTNYIPWGYKIPILNAQTTTNIYLGSTQTTRQIKKLVLTGQEDWAMSSSYNVFYARAYDYLKVQDIICICTHYVTIANVTDIPNVGANECTFNSVNSWLYIKDTNCATAADFQTYLQQQYTNGTPVIIYYVLNTATTRMVNEPLMKIGDYSDSISNAAAILATDGANNITVDTTVQPSEFSATWSGWHDSSVKEYDGTNWQ